VLALLNVNFEEHASCEAIQTGQKKILTIVLLIDFFINVSEFDYFSIKNI